MGNFLNYFNQVEALLPEGQEVHSSLFQSLDLGYSRGCSHPVGFGRATDFRAILDKDNAEGRFPDRLNAEMVNLEHLSNPWDENFLKGMIERHRKLTGSRHALDILTRWDHYRRIFWKVFPNPPEALAFKEHKAEMEETFLVLSGF